jgi:hypothetical protein
MTTNSAAHPALKALKVAPDVQDAPALQAPLALPADLVPLALPADLVLLAFPAQLVFPAQLALLVAPVL